MQASFLKRLIVNIEAGNTKLKQRDLASMSFVKRLRFFENEVSNPHLRQIENKYTKQLGLTRS